MYVRRNGRRRNGRALSGVSSQPYGSRVYHQLAPVGMGLAVVSSPIGVLRKIATQPPPPKQRAIAIPKFAPTSRLPVAMSGVSSQPYGSRVYHQLAPLGGIFGDDEPSILEPTVVDATASTAAAASVDTINTKIDEMLRRQKIEADARRMSQLVAVAGALFAAARLGIIWLPWIKQKIKPGSTGG